MKKNISKNFLILTAFVITFLSISANAVFLFNKNTMRAEADDLVFNEEEATIRAIKNVSPAVVNIVAYDYDVFESIDNPTGKKEMLKYKKEKGRGTGFIITSDGYIVTNRHIVSATTKENGEYKITLYSGKEYYAQLIGQDPFYDLAILKIFDKDLPVVDFANSDSLQVGSTVIAIGNSLGRYQNSATKGIVSGLGRSLTASNPNGGSEALSNVIQTDAEINRGNSGGPLVNLSGKVVGINSALDQGGTSIGFALPINDALPIINSIKERGVISRPMLGVNYLTVTPEVAKQYGLKRNDGAWIVVNDDETSSIVPDSAAAIGGLMEGDIIFEINAIKIDEKNTLSNVIQKYKVGNRIGLKIQRGDEVMVKIVTLKEN